MNILLGYCKCGKYISWDRMKRDPPTHSYNAINGEKVKETCAPRWVLDAGQMMAMNEWVKALSKETFSGEDWDHWCIDVTQMYGFNFPKILIEAPALVNEVLRKCTPLA